MIGFKSQALLHRDLSAALTNQKMRADAAAPLTGRSGDIAPLLLCMSDSGFPSGAPEGKDLMTEQIALFRFQRLGNQYQYCNNQVSGKNAQQPLGHFQGQKRPLALSAVAGGHEHLR